MAALKKKILLMKQLRRSILDKDHTVPESPSPESKISILQEVMQNNLKTEL